MRLDFTSDTHIDFYANPGSLPDISEFLPDVIGRALVIAGDLGHNNTQNIQFISKMREFYGDVILVRGNHDLYLTRNETQEFVNSRARWNDMVSRAREIPGVHYLDGDVVEIEGVKIGGCGMWCDGSYASRYFGISPDLLKRAHPKFSDYMFIKDFEDMTEVCAEEREKMSRIIDNCDVLVSHYGPDMSRVPRKYHGPSTGFFYFDGEDLLARAAGKIWIYGHTHDSFDYPDPKHGCRMLCNPYGYPYEHVESGSKIVGIDVNPGQ